MGTVAARQALDDNLRNYVSAHKDPVMYNLCRALKEITLAIDSIEWELGQVKKKLAHP